MSLTVKAFLHDDWLSEPIETRRFALDQDVATNYTYLTEKLAQVFPQVKPQDIIISYLDTDGDRITVSSDEELTDALDQFDGTIFRLHIKKRNTANDESSPFNQFPLLFPPFLHQPSHRAHGPQWWGNRNAGCHWKQGQAAHAQPPKTDTPPQSDKPKDNPEEVADKENPKEQQEETKQQKGPYHPGVVCDGCNGSIYGRRFKCTTCPDYDLCGGCEEKGVHTDHNMYTIDQPRPCGGRPRWGGPGFGGPFSFGPFGGTFELWGNPGRFTQGRPCWGGFGQCDPSKSTKKEDESMETNQNSDTSPFDAAFAEVFEQLKAMGFEDEGGWLYELVKSKQGDLQKILDALNPAEAQTKQQD